MTPLRVALKDLREKRGLSQEALGVAAEVRQATISEMESGRTRRVSLDVLERLAKALGVQPGELLVSEPKRKR